MPSDAPASRRLHPATLLFTIGGSVKNLLLPGIAVLWFAQGHRAEFWFMALFVPTVLLQLFRYFSLSYRFGPSELVIRSGVISRNERHIPYDRIDNVDLVQGPLHRLLGVAEVRLQTASGADAEATFQVLSLAAVNELREHIFSQRAEAPGRVLAVAPQTAANVVAQLSFGDLVKLGLISMRGVALIFVALGFAWEFDLFDRLDFEWVAGIGGVLTQQTPAAVAIVMLATAVILLLIVLSIAWTVLRFYGYRLERHGEDLRVSCGLITRVAATVPRQRIQFVTVQETIGHRLFRCVSIHIETAGGKEEKSDVSSKWFVPLLPRAELGRVLDELRPGLDLQNVAWQPLARGAWRRKLTRGMLFAGLLGGASFLLLSGWAILLLAVLASWAVCHAIMSIRMTGYALLPEGIAFRSGVLTRNTSATFFDKMQVLTLSQSPFDRRHKMATLAVDTAGAGPAGHVIHIPYLEAGKVGELLATMFVKTEAAMFRW